MVEEDIILKQYQNVGRRIGSMTGLGGKMIQYLFLGSMKWSLNFPDVTGTDYNKKGGIIIIIIFNKIGERCKVHSICKFI